MLSFMPGTPLVDCGGGRLRFGAHEEDSYTLTNMSANDIAFIKGMKKACDMDEVLQLASRLQLSDDRRTKLLSMLAKLPCVTEEDIGEWCVDTLWWKRLEGQSSYVDRRRSSRVCVSYAPGLGYHVIRHLANDGIGMIIVSDSQLVGPYDIGPYDRNSLSFARNEAVIDQLSTFESQIIRRASWWHIEVCITPFYIDTERAHMAMTSETPFLPVVYDDSGVSVGPLVVPGVSACTNCLLMRRYDNDRFAAYRDMQLLDTDSCGVESVLAVEVSAFLFRAICDFLAGKPSGLENTLYRFTSYSRWPEPVKVYPHERCGCTYYSAVSAPPRESFPSAV